MYDPSVFGPAVTAVTGRYLPYLNPPMLAWLVVPLTWFPYQVAAAGPRLCRGIARSAAGYPGPIQVSLPRQLPFPMVAIAIVIVAGLFVFSVYRARGIGPEMPIAIGMFTSLLLSPYANFYDLSGLALAVWLVLRTNPPLWQRGTLLVLWAALYLAPILPLFVLLCECGWLASLAALIAVNRTGAVNRHSFVQLPARQLEMVRRWRSPFVQGAN